MKAYTKAYYNFFGYSPGDFVPCEVCGGPAVDIHHIRARGMGGNPLRDKDKPHNLIALCREDHQRAELEREPYLRADELTGIHQQTYTQHGKEWPHE